MTKVLVMMNNSIHIDNGIVNKDRQVFGYLKYMPILGKSVHVLNEELILGTTPVIATRLRKKLKGKLNLKENSVIFETMNSEYEIFFNQNFEKSKIIE